MPHFPPGSQVVGAICVSDNPNDLGEDMLDAILPDGKFLCIGWYLDMVFGGQYLLSVESDTTLDSHCILSFWSPYAAVIWDETNKWLHTNYRY